MHEPKFHSWFKQHLGQVMKENIIAPIRKIAGLGSPPEFYTQNVAECCNSIIKGDAGTKMEWSDFCVSVQETAEQQEREVKKAVHQMGEYRLAPKFKHLKVRADKWLKMTNAQREGHTVNARISAQLPISAPLQISAPPRTQILK